MIDPLDINFIIFMKVSNGMNAPCFADYFNI